MGILVMMEHNMFLKYMHIVGFTGWIGALYFITNLLSSARVKEDQEGKLFAEKALAINKKIANPAMMITWTAGLLMLYIYGMLWFKENGWMHQKLLLIVYLTVFHLYIKRAINQAGKQPLKPISTVWYVADKLPLIFLLSIVFLAVFRQLPPIIAGIPVAIVSIIMLYITYFWKDKT